MKISGYKFGHPVFGLEDYYDFKPDVSIEQKIEDEQESCYLRLALLNNCKQVAAC